MGKRAARRTRSPHPGVVLVRRKRADGPDRWRAKYTDPDTGRTVWETLDGPAYGYTTKKECVAWCTDKSKHLQDRKAKIGAGAPRVVGTGIEETVDAFIEVRKPELRKRTIESLELSLGYLKRWASGRGIRETSEIDRPALASFREYVVALKRSVPVKGGERGERTRTKAGFAPKTKNRILREVGSFFRFCRERALVKFDSDAVKDGLRKVKTQRSLPSFLDRDAIRATLEAALRHDGERFSMTRKEAKAGRPKGRTRRYEPAAPFLLMALATGARRKELEGLRWQEVNLKTGKLTLPATRVKTAQERIVDLAVSPSAWTLLKSLKLAAGKATLVFPGYAGGSLCPATVRRLRAEYGAPEELSLQACRRTVSTFGTNMLSFGPWRSAKRLGHSVVIAERDYAGLVEVPDDAETLEEAMGIEALAERIVRAAGGQVENPAESVTRGA